MLSSLIVLSYSGLRSSKTSRWKLQKHLSAVQTCSSLYSLASQTLSGMSGEERELCNSAQIPLAGTAYMILEHSL